MDKAGIKDPNGKKGVRFCLKCPYDRCVVFEMRGRPSEGSMKSQIRKKLVIELSKEGFTPVEIMMKTGASISTINRYLRHERLDSEVS